MQRRGRGSAGGGAADRGVAAPDADGKAGANEARTRRRRKRGQGDRAAKLPTAHIIRTASLTVQVKDVPKALEEPAPAPRTRAATSATRPPPGTRRATSAPASCCACPPRSTTRSSPSWRARASSSTAARRRGRHRPGRGRGEPHQVAARECGPGPYSAGGRDGKDDTDADAAVTAGGWLLPRRLRMRGDPGRTQPVTHRLVQRRGPPHLGRQPPGLLAEAGHVLPRQPHHQRQLRLAVGQGVHRRSNSVVHRLFLTSAPRDPPSPRRGRLPTHTHAQDGCVSQRCRFTGGAPGTRVAWWTRAAWPSCVTSRRSWTSTRRCHGS
ncbi:hypothetical protein SVIOM74S_05564 [Streptomyces violarus]